MALPKVCGLETEYGIMVRGAENNPVTASSTLINAYVAATARKRGRIGWDFEDEHPSNDARGFSLDDSLAPEVETTLVNAVLTNGARYYVDHAHPEISTPEVTTALEAVIWDRAAEEIVRASMIHARSVLPDGAEIVVHKNNSDGKGNSYGCHENYLLAREQPVRPSHRPDHAALRHPPGVLRRRQGRLRTSGPPARPRRLPAEPAGRLLRRGDRPRNHAQATDRQHP